MKENIIAKYNEGEWFLEHSWYLDDFGLKRNRMEIYKIQKDGMKIIHPFFPPFRVNDYDKSKPFEGDVISPYETFEYSDMLREQISKIQ